MDHMNDIAKPLLSNINGNSSPGYTLSDNDQSIEQPGRFPMPSWTLARYDDNKRRFPQTIAHRGYKAAFPENTLKAFRGAVEVGAHAIETDIHLTKDDVVVLSHDPDLKRCFGKEEKLSECDWDYVSQLKTLRAPHEPMPRLYDLLEYAAQPEQQDIWILLDIKTDNDADKVMRLIADCLKSVHPGRRQWADRVVLGIWATKFLPLCEKYAPGFSVSHISWSPYYTRQFLDVPNISFNLLQRVLVGPVGRRLIKDIKAANRPLFFWTVNSANLMKWSIQQEADGVITDDPKLFDEVCERWRDDEPRAKLTWPQALYVIWLQLLVFVFSNSLRRKFPEKIEAHFILKDSKAKVALVSG